MAVEIVMPKLGWTMEEGVLAEWMKQDGDTVQPGDILFTVESDKALQEVEAFDGGILRIPASSPPVGSVIAVGGLLGYLLQPGETLPADVRATPPSASAAPATPAAAEPAPAAAPPRKRQAISPRARRAALRLNLDWSELTGSGRSGRIVERDVLAAAALRTSDAGQPAARKRAGAEVTPVARRAATELGVDLSTLSEQHPGQRITRDLVEQAHQQPAPAPAATPDVSRTPISSTRRIIAERMSRSAHTTAPVTLFAEVDATELVAMRKALKHAGRAPVPSYTDLLIRITATALEAHPDLNARLEDDHVIHSKAVNIGLAVDSPRGLLVPVIRDAQAKTVRQIALESGALIESARQGTLKGDAMRGSTFSITNLGMFDIDMFTPIINLPECAILGVGRITPQQVVVDADAKLLAIRHMMFTSLTFDHRLVDGAPAARFLQHIRRLIEQPYLWMLG